MEELQWPAQSPVPTGIGTLLEPLWNALVPHQCLTSPALFWPSGHRDTFLSLVEGLPGGSKAVTAVKGGRLYRLIEGVMVRCPHTSDYEYI